ncbi:hypothetical protein K3495_g7121 [Podosphaera aphanis]|nr:hypothetical protein K3495_g7121 [Podosphaera aphanis]
MARDNRIEGTKERIDCAGEIMKDVAPFRRPILSDQRGLDQRVTQALISVSPGPMNILRQARLVPGSTISLIYAVAILCYLSIPRAIATTSFQTTDLSAAIHSIPTDDTVLKRGSTLTPPAALLVERTPLEQGIDKTDIHANNRAPILSPNVNHNQQKYPATKSVTLAPTQTSEDDDLQTPTPSATAWPMPRAFDVGFNNNLTSACHNFMDMMLESETFKDCLPVSMLLQNSNSFFQASKNPNRITSLLDKSCNAPITTCTNVLNSFASNLTSPSACGTDFNHQNPQISSAVLGLQSYRTLFTATCLHSSPDDIVNNATSSISNPSIPHNPDTSYCFANAITNVSNPTNSYIYYLPLNISLVDSAVPTCNTCLRSTMSVFQQATANPSNVLTRNYVKAAKQINVVCGPKFVNDSIVTSIGNVGMSPPIGGPLYLLYFTWLYMAWVGWLI